MTPRGRVRGRACAWCRGRIVAIRQDAIYCTTRCRQAAHRAGVRRSELGLTDRPLRLAYADPPYPGLAARYYAGHADYAGEIDHAELLSRLATFDGWALSTSARALPSVLRIAGDLLPGLPGVGVAAWYRGAVPHGQAHVLNAWEPVIYSPARRVVGIRARQVHDALTGVVPRRRSTLPTAVVGMKPPEFCVWLFELLGAMPGDSLADLYPGSGIVARTWRLWQTGNPAGVEQLGLVATLG